jgi:hypothetical protein
VPAAALDEFEQSLGDAGVQEEGVRTSRRCTQLAPRDRHYDFTAATSVSLRLRELCSVLVHSFVFMPEMEEDGRTLSGLLFNSDGTKDSVLYRVPWAPFAP